MVVVGFDVVFAEYDRTSPDKIAKSYSNLDPKTREALMALPSNEQTMANAMRRIRTVLGQVGNYGKLPAGKLRTKIKSSVKAELGGNPRPFLSRYESLTSNVPELEAAAIGVGYFSLAPDVDSVVRRVPLISVVGTKDIRPHLTLEMLRVAYGGTMIFTKKNEGGMESVALQTPQGSFDIPTDVQGRVWVHYSAPATHNGPIGSSRIYISASDILKGRVSKSRLRGHLVILGASAAGLRDLKRTPLSPALPGVEVHTNLLENIFYADNKYRNDFQKLAKQLVEDGKNQAQAVKEATSAIDRRDYFLRYPNFSKGAELLLAIVTGIFLTILLPKLGPVWTLLSIVLTDVALGWFSWYSYSENLLLFDVTYPGSVSFAVYLIMTFSNYVGEQQKNTFIRKSFEAYLSPDLIEEMVQAGTEPELGGSSGIRTAYFTDIASFSSFSEILTATQLVELLNEYLTVMTDALLAEGGTLDKYEGDAIVAFFGAPIIQNDNAARALRTALIMQQHLANLREHWSKDGKWPDLVKQMRMRIGIASDDIVTGNMGSTTRMNYTMMGDTVNTAARLEAAAKQYGINIHCTTESLRLAGSDDFEWRNIDKVRVMGKSEALETVEIMGLKGQIAEERVRMRALFHQGMELYRQQKWDEAKAAFAGSEKLEELFPNRPTTPSRVFMERCDRYKADPPGAGWDGTWIMTSK